MASSTDPKGSLTIEPERFFQNFVGDLPARIWAKESEGRYVFVNDEVVRAFGKRLEECIGATDEELFPRTGFVNWRKDQQVLSSRQPLVTTDQIGRDKYLFVLRFPLTIDGKPHVGAIGVETTPHIDALLSVLKVQDQLF